MRGNVDTRLSFVRDGELDAVVLARAGLARLGRADEATEVLDPLQVLPAPGQGALAVECRADDAELIALLAALDDADTRAAVTAERALLAALEAGCTAPVGALAEVVESLDADGAATLELSLRAVVGRRGRHRDAVAPQCFWLDRRARAAAGRRARADLLAGRRRRPVTAEVADRRPRTTIAQPAPRPDPAEHSPERAP